MDIINTSIPDVKILEPRVFGDERGFFMETFRDEWFRSNVADETFVQDNHSKSRQNTLRGLHLQLDRPQGKLVRVVSGAVFDVAVDVRKGSESFGRWFGCCLSEENRRQLWVPPGFAHGFLVLSSHAEFVYKCTEYYDPGSEKTLLWSDQSIAIKWPETSLEAPLLSAKDQQGLSLGELERFL